MTNKTVSIVMCTYNGERYLKEQLMSLLNQTYSPIEIIIQDDLSTDNTLEIIHDYQENILAPFICSRIQGDWDIIKISCQPTKRQMDTI